MSLTLCLLSCESKNGGSVKETKTEKKFNEASAANKDTVINGIAKEDRIADLPKAKNNKYYVNTLKKHLEKISANNVEIKNIYTDKEGDLRTDDIDGNFLSVYGLSEAEIFNGDVNEDGKSETIIVIANSGGGGGGNVEMLENYLIVNDTVVSRIDDELNNAPKNKFGYNIYLREIRDGYVLIDFVLKNENDVVYSRGKEEKLKCRLINNKLMVEN